MLLHDRVVGVLNHCNAFRIAPTSGVADRMSEATSIHPALDGDAQWSLPVTDGLAAMSPGCSQGWNMTPLPYQPGA